MGAFLPFFIIIVAVILVAGPIFMLQPTKRQRQQERLRRLALEQGLHVQMRSIPPGLHLERKESHLPVYTLRFDDDHAMPSWLLVKGKTQHDIHFYDQWNWVGQPPTLSKNQGAELQRFIDQLPKGSLGVGVDRQTVHVFWREVGVDSEVARLHAWLQEFRSWCLKELATPATE